MTFVFFSKDRPLQLDAALVSWRRHCQDELAPRVVVLFKASSSRQFSLYRQLMREHPSVDFVREFDFRRDLRVLLRGCDAVGFVVDDSIFVRDFSATQIAAALQAHPDALGFSMRLGRNTTQCYSLNCPQKLPAFEAANGSLRFQWTDAEADFGYPLELSSSVYRGDIVPLLDDLSFNNPNTLENALHQNLGKFRASHPRLLCAEKSLGFSVPVNLTQTVCVNRHANRPDYSIEALTELFAQGQRIDTAALDGFTPTAAHQEIEWNLIKAGPVMPLVSVVIPCYNQATYLPEAVASVAKQTTQKFEIIIVNDGSPDDTASVAAQLIEQYPALSIRLVNKKNEGLAMARNDGIEAAAGAYILPLDADDKIAPAMLAKTTAVLESRPEVPIVYTDVQYFGAENKIVKAAEFDFARICRDNQLNYCSLFRREVWEAVGGYNANIWGYEDWDFWVGCAELGLRPVRIPEALLLYRVKPNSMLTDALQHDAELRARLKLNHPQHFSVEEIVASRRICSNPALPLPKYVPKVSVIVPTFNRPAMLEETLRSVLAQTMQDFEIIVVNDCGIDIGSVLGRLKAGPRVVHLRHSTNRGLAAARNTGRRFARGKYIAFLDDDDVFLPDHLETLVSHLELTGAKIAYTDAWRASQKIENGRVTSERTVLYSREWDNDLILVENFVPVLCFLHERALGIAAGDFDESLTTHEDWDYWIRLSRLARPVHLAKVTCEFRVPPDNSSMSSGVKTDFLRTARVIYRKYRAESRGKKEVLQRQRKFIRHLKRNIRHQRRELRARWWRNFWNGRRATAGLIILLALLLPRQSEGVVLARNHVAETVIVTDPNATATERFAAHELASQLEKITGATFEIRTNSRAPAHAIILGGGAAARKLFKDVPYDGLGDEEFVIRSHGEHLLLCGGRPRGTLYAVSRFLQEQCGARWWTSWASTIPKHATLQVKDLNIREKPAFEYREPYWFAAQDADWARRNECNGNFCAIPPDKGGHILYSGFVHTFYPLVPPDKYFSSHPEWFSLVNGRRSGTNAQLCLTNPKLREFVAHQVEEQLRAAPDANIISVSQNDCLGACECPGCSAVDEAEGSHSGAMLEFVNYIAQQIEPDFPKVAVDTLAYQYTRKPPRTLRPRPNVIVRLCSIECNFGAPMDDPSNASFADDVRGWSERSDRLYIWDYVTDFGNYLQPHPNWFVLGPNLRFFQAHHVRGVFEEGAYESYGAEMSEMRAWVLAQLLWNPQQDDRALIREFLNGYYGAAGGPIIWRYLELLHDASSQYYLSCGSPTDAPFLQFKTLTEAETLWQQAEASVAGDDDLLARVRLGHLPVRYVWLARWDELRKQCAAAQAKWPLPDSQPEVVSQWRVVAEGLPGKPWTKVGQINEGGLTPEKFLSRFH